MITFDGVNQQADYDALWLRPDAPGVVRIESFDSTTQDDCGNGDPFFLAMYSALSKKEVPIPRNISFTAAPRPCERTTSASQRAWPEVPVCRPRRLTQ